MASLTLVRSAVFMGSVHASYGVVLGVVAVANFVLSEHANAAAAPVVKAEPRTDENASTLTGSGTIEQDDGMLAWQKRMVMIGVVNVRLKKQKLGPVGC